MIRDLKYICDLAELSRWWYEPHFKIWRARKPLPSEPRHDSLAPSSAENWLMGWPQFRPDIVCKLITTTNHQSS
jgi:hypothetical protein